MDHLVCMFHGGSVKENEELENMSKELKLIDGPPCFKDLVGRVTSKFVCRGDEVQLMGCFDCE